MISNMVKSYLSVVSSVFTDHGLACAIKYNPINDAKDEWRKMQSEINAPTPDTGWEGTKTSNQVLVTYSRSTARKSSSLGRNNRVISQMEVEGSTQSNRALYVEVDVDLTILCDNVATMDIVELLLLAELSNREFAVSGSVKLAPDADQEDGFEYNVSTSDLGSYNDIDGSNLRTLTIPATITGVVLLPFYVRNEMITTMCVEVWAFNKSVEPIPPNKDDGEFCYMLNRN